MTAIPTLRNAQQPLMQLKNDSPCNSFCLCFNDVAVPGWRWWPSDRPLNDRWGWLEGTKEGHHGDQED